MVKLDSPDASGSVIDGPPRIGAAADTGDMGSEAGGDRPKLGDRSRDEAGLNTAAGTSSHLLERRREAEADRELVELARSGDRKAFQSLVERHQRRAFGVALGLLRDEQDAREVVQEAFLRVYRSLDRFEGTASFFTWLYRIVTNLSIDRRRKPSRREHERLDLDPEDGPAPIQLVAPPEGEPSEYVRRQEIGARIQSALDALPPYHRAVIVMREVEGLSYQEMAEAMGVSKGTIMSRLFHARQKLQRALVDCYREHLGSEPNASEGVEIVSEGEESP